MTTILEKIQKLKEKHHIKDVFQIAVPNAEGELKNGFFKKPDLKAISASSSVAASDPVRSGLILFEQCWLDGDTELREDDEMKMSCIVELGKLFQIRQAEVKKL